MSGAAPKTILVTGGAGFIGSNLASRLASEGHRVRVFDALSRPGVEANLEWLTHRHGNLIEPVIADVRNAARVTEAVHGVDAVFHFAAQVAVTTSMMDPREDLDVNIGGTFNLLEAVRMDARHARRNGTRRRRREQLQSRGLRFGRQQSPAQSGCRAGE